MTIGASQARPERDDYAEELALACDRAAVAQIEAVPRILEVVCRITGLGFSAVARVTETRWIACAVRDEISFGLVPGGELVVGTTICNEIRQHRQLVVIDDVAADDVFREHPTPRQYGFRSYISIPILLHDGRFFGTLCAIDRAPARLNTVETIEMFRLFAELIGFHLEAADRMSVLEVRVAERTAALRTLTIQLETAQEEERARIARELHDDLGQSLTALRLDIEGLSQSLNRPAPDVCLTSTRDALDSMSKTVNSAFDSLDRIVTELRPAVLDALGIGAAIEWLVEEFRRRTGLTFVCHCDHVTVADATASILFRVLQEALTNVVRHAAASSVTVVLRQDATGVALTVTDDGCGIQTRAVVGTEGHGLLGMAERLRSIQGTLTIEHIGTGGTVLVAHCPN